MKKNMGLEDKAFLLLLILVTIAFGMVLKPFFSAILWAVLLVILFIPMHRKILKFMGERRILAALTTLLVVNLIFIIPLALIVTALGVEANAFYERIQSGNLDVQTVTDQVTQKFPFVETAAGWFNLDLSNIESQINEAGLKASQFIAKQAVSVGQNTFTFSLNLVLTGYLAFFLLIDHQRLIRILIWVLPLGDDRERMLFRKFTEVSRATIKGNLVVGAVQGTLGGLIFWILGIQGPFLWGVVMAFLSLLPAVGAALIWAPTAIFLALSDQVVPAIILALYGFFVIGMADNVLRPILVGRDTKLPDYIVLLSTLGGLALFGINGFVIGPVIAALFIAFWQIFTIEFNDSAADTFDEQELITEAEAKAEDHGHEGTHLDAAPLDAELEPLDHEPDRSSDRQGAPKPPL
ncbi:AI-2E family transporter [Allohahella marinimesophila]